MTEINNNAVAELITNNLGALPHPDGNQTASVLGKTSSLQPGMAEVVTKAASRLGTSIVHLIETSGWSIVRADDIADLRNQVADVDPTKAVRVQCNTCGGHLFDLGLRNPQLATVSGATLRRHFRGEVVEGCACA